MSITLKNKMIDGVPHLLNEEDMTYYPTIKQDPETGLTYTLDPETFLYIPNLTVTADEREIGLWGMRRKKYLKEHKSWVYLRMMDEHKLTDHLIAIDEAAEARMEALTKEMMENEGVTEKLKADDWMEWVRRSSSIQCRAEEIVLDELIYR